ncbi:hypothetical protein ACQFYA_20855 [Promicromonospora sp. Marseille-Q5078]
MSTGAGETYDYQQVVERIAQTLGARPSKSTLRAATVRPAKATAHGGRPRITERMPAPLPARPQVRRAFSAEQVEAWLREHPWLQYDAALRRGRERLEAGAPTEDVVQELLAARVSWEDVAAVLGDAGGPRLTKEGVRRKFLHLQRP